MNETGGSQSRSLAEYCVEVLGEPESWEVPEGYSSLALCVIDSIWSIGVRYQGIVVPVLQRYRAFRAADGHDANSDSVEDLIEVICTVGGSDAFARTVAQSQHRTSTRNGILKAEAVLLEAQVLATAGMSTTTDVGGASVDILSTVEAAWRSIPGQGSGISWRYFLMLARVEGVKPDRMVRRFVAKAAGHPAEERFVSLVEADRAVRQAYVELRTDHPKLTLRALDHAIWRYQSLPRAHA